MQIASYTTAPAARPWAQVLLLAALCLTGAPAVAAEPWQPLFADADWYRSQSGQERDFSGVLEAIPPSGFLTTLQRDAQYRLGDRTLYTGAQRHPTLDALVGAPVVIRGKAVDMELEGTQVREIWPAAVRRGD